MKIDPRNPALEDVVSSGSDHPFHAALRKTLVLLKIESVRGPVYFVVEGLHTWPLEDGVTLGAANEYFYEEHTCPTNFIPIPMVSFGGDPDPHGVFEVVDAVWMTTEYDALEDEDEYLIEAFPQMSGAPTIDGTLAAPMIDLRKS